jgi:hypothetical protein
MAKYEGSHHLPRITPGQCLRSPITCTIYLLKKQADIHIESFNPNLPINPTSLEITWITQARDHPDITIHSIHKFLQKLLQYQITSLAQITLPDGLHLMSPIDFQSHYTKPSKIIGQALAMAARIFYYPPCPVPCLHHCITHHAPNTLLQQFQTQANDLIPPTTQPAPYNPPTYSRPPPQSLHNRHQYPISSILQHRHKTHLDKYGALKTVTTYLCQWSLPNGTLYNNWCRQDYIVPYQQPHISTRGLLLLKQYYTTARNKFYHDLFLTNFHPLQLADTRFIHPSLVLPLIDISTSESNLDSHITINTPTLQVNAELASI